MGALAGPPRSRLTGARKVAAFAAAITPRGSVGLVARIGRLNGQPACIVRRADRIFAAIMISAGPEGIRGVFIQADPAKLGGVGPGAPHD